MIYESMCGRYEKYPFWAAAPKGSRTYAFTHMGNFLRLVIKIWALGLDLGHKAGI